MKRPKGLHMLSQRELLDLQEGDRYFVEIHDEDSGVEYQTPCWSGMQTMEVERNAFSVITVTTDRARAYYEPWQIQRWNEGYAFVGDGHALVIYGPKGKSA